MKRFVFASMLLWVAASMFMRAEEQPGIRLVHLAEGVPNIHAYFQNFLFIQNIAPGCASAVRTEFPAGSYPVEIKDTSSSKPKVYAATTVDLNADTYHSLALLGTTSGTASLLLTWNNALPQIGNIKLRFVNAVTGTSASIAIQVGGSLYFSEIKHYTGSSFIEVPLAQAVTVGILSTHNSVKLASFKSGTTFEAGNVYTVYFTGSIHDPQARVLIDNIVDEQKKLPFLERVGDQLSLRAVNLSDNFPPLEWRFNENPLFTGEYLTATESIPYYADGSQELSVYKSGDAFSIPYLTQPLTLVKNIHYTLIAYDNTSSLNILSLPWDKTPAPGGKAKVRLANMLQGVTVKVENPDPLFPLLTYGTASEFREISTQKQTMRVLREDGVLLAEVEWTPSSMVYTLFVADRPDGVNVYALSESNADRQQPLFLLKKIIKSSARLRFVHALGNAPRITFLANDQPIDSAEFASTSAARIGFPTGNYQFKAAAPGIPSGEFSASVPDNENSLVVFMGSSSSPRGFLYTSPLSLHPSPGKALVRFIHAVPDLGVLSIKAENGTILINALSFGEASVYIEFPVGERKYDIRNEQGISLVTLIDQTMSESVLTVFLLPTEKTTPAAFAMFDNNDAAFTPMLSLQTTTDVQDPARQSAIIAGNCQPNPVTSGAEVQVLLPVATHVEAYLVTNLGVQVQEIANTFMDQGGHTLVIRRKNLPAGVYFLHIQVGNFLVIRKVIITQ